MGKQKKSKKDTAAKLKAQAKESAYKVWLAGLGALAIAEAEGGKLFGKLVERGEELEKRGKPVVDELAGKAKKARADAGAKAGKVGDDAKAVWGKVESVVEDKVSATLNRLGIPSRDEIEALTKRVEALTKKLSEASAPKKAAAKSTAARKPTKKTAAAKKPAVKKPAVKKVAAKKTARKRVAKRPVKTAALKTDA